MSDDPATATTTSRAPRTLAYACPTITEDGVGVWWSARHIVALGAPLAAVVAARTAAGCSTALVEVVYDLPPIETGLDTVRWVHPHERQAVEIPLDDLLVEAETASTSATDADEHGDLEDHESGNQARLFALARDRHRIDHNLPRCVVRSDVYDTATGARAPLYALRHPWPAGTTTQGGSASRSVNLADGEPEPDGATVVTNRTGARIAVFRDRVFIEAFPPPTPDNPSGGFIRGTGATFNQAEDAAWAQWSAKQSCRAVTDTGAHRWETRGYRNGAGFCADCGVFGSGVFDLRAIGSVCVVCGDPYYDEIPALDSSGHPDRGAEPTLVCAAHAPAHYAAIDAWLQTGRDDEEDSHRPLTDAEKTLIGESVTPGQWRAMDFDDRWGTAARIRHAILARIT